MAPEILLNKAFTCRADIFSFGIMLCEMLGVYPEHTLEGISYADTINHFRQIFERNESRPTRFFFKDGHAHVDVSRGVSAERYHSMRELFSLLESCLRVIPDQRATAAQLLELPLFADRSRFIAQTELIMTAFVAGRAGGAAHRTAVGSSVLSFDSKLRLTTVVAGAVGGGDNGSVNRAGGVPVSPTLGAKSVNVASVSVHVAPSTPHRGGIGGGSTFGVVHANRNPRDRDVVRQSTGNMASFLNGNSSPAGATASSSDFGGGLLATSPYSPERLTRDASAERPRPSPPPPELDSTASDVAAAVMAAATRDSSPLPPPPFGGPLLQSPQAIPEADLAYSPFAVPSARRDASGRQPPPAAISVPTAAAPTATATRYATTSARPPSFASPASVSGQPAVPFKFTFGEASPATSGSPSQSPNVPSFAIPNFGGDTLGFNLMETPDTFRKGLAAHDSNQLLATFTPAVPAAAAGASHAGQSQSVPTASSALRHAYNNSSTPNPAEPRPAGSPVWPPVNLLHVSQNNGAMQASGSGPGALGITQPPVASAALGVLMGTSPMQPMLPSAPTSTENYSELGLDHVRIRSGTGPSAVPDTSVAPDTSASSTPAPRLQVVDDDGTNDGAAPE
jgi:hypothetical protein